MKIAEVEACMQIQTSSLPKQSVNKVEVLLGKGKGTNQVHDTGNSVKMVHQGFTMHHFV